MNSDIDTRRIIFVFRQLGPEALRSAQALHRLKNVCLFGIGESASEVARDTFSHFTLVDDVHNPNNLVEAALRFGEKHEPFEQLVTAHETLLEPVASANAALGLKGMDIFTVRRVLDKSLLKATLEKASLKTPRSTVLINSKDAQEFGTTVGFPIVLKPMNGSGGLATLCIRDPKQLALAVELMQPTHDEAVLAEEYITGEEVCIDTITINHEPQIYSICHYRPSILEAVENPQIQWRCIMPRDLSDDRSKNLIKDGLKAVRALRVGNALTHMEAFRFADGTHTFTDATLRPAGARIGPMLGCAYDLDIHLTWAKVAVNGFFDGPYERKYAVGTIFLRGHGYGTVQDVTGIETVTRDLSQLITAKRWPQVGANKSATYTGDGYVTVRHRDVSTVEAALDFISKTVAIDYSEIGPPSSETVREQWGTRLQYLEKQLNAPVWESDGSAKP